MTKRLIKPDKGQVAGPTDADITDINSKLTGLLKGNYTAGVDFITNYSTPTTFTVTPTDPTVKKGPFKSVVRQKTNPYDGTRTGRYAHFYHDPDEEELEDHNEEESEEGNKEYKEYIERLGRVYTLYKESGDIIYLIKILIGFFNGYSNNSLMFNPDKSHPTSKEQHAQADRNGFIVDLTGSGLIMDENIEVKIKEDAYNIFLALYSAPLNSKRFRIGVVTIDMYDELMTKLITKGVKVDPEIKEIAKTINFNEKLTNGRCLSMCYIPPLNIIVNDSNTGHSLSDLLMDLGFAHEELDKLPDVIDIRTLKSDDIITIDGKDFSKSAFESMVETTCKNFLSNLKFETLMEDKEIADSSIVDVESKLI